MSDSVLLIIALQTWFDKPLSALPEALKERVEQDFAPIRWDELSRGERMAEAIYRDLGHNPENSQQEQYWRSFVERKTVLEQRITAWKTVATPTASDLEQKEIRLAALAIELAEMEQQQRQARGDYGHQCTSIDSDKESAHITADQTNSNAELQSVSPARNSSSAPTAPIDDACAVFRSLDNLHPSEIAISIVGDISEGGLTGNGILEISARGVTRRLALAEFGLVDRRSGALNKQAAVLLGLAKGQKILRSEEKHAATMTRLRGEFRDRLGVTVDPFTKHSRRTGWQPLFSIVDLRGLSDKRAKDDAERKTVSFDQLQEQGRQFAADESEHHDDGEEDAASTWLKENDPKHLA